MTIIELLIVMMILLMVTAAAIPLMAPAVQNRRMRETARLVSSYFNGARARAIETGRPVGVMIERFNGQSFSMNLSYVEVPAPYSGDNLGATCTVTQTGPQYSESVNNVPAGYTPQWFSIAVPTVNFNSSLIRVGDTIRLNYRGVALTVLGPDIGPKLTNAGATAEPDGVIDTYDPTASPPATRILDVAYLRAATSPPVYFPWGPAPSQPLGYQIIRQPIRSSAAPLQLPEGIIIDLQFSGMGPEGTFAAIRYNTPPPPAVPPTPPTYFSVSWNPVLMFTPNGALKYVSTPAGNFPPSGPIFFLLGRRELMNDVTDSQYDENFFDPVTTNPKNLYLQNFWVSINHASSHVVVTENASNIAEPFTDTNGNGYYDSSDMYSDVNGNGVRDPAVSTGRRFALEAQSIGGQ